MNAMYISPWLDAATGEEYGPAPSTMRRQYQRLRDWAWRRPPRRPRNAIDPARVHALLLAGDTSIPDRERQVGAMVYLDGMAVRAAARELGLSRATVREYLTRLSGRLG